MLKRFLRLCACVVLAITGCATAPIASTDPSSFSPPSDGRQGTLYGTVVGASRFEIFTSDGRQYSISVNGPTTAPHLFIVVDRGRSFSIARVVLHDGTGNDREWAIDGLQVLFMPAATGYLGRFTFTNDGRNVTVERRYQADDLKLLKSVFNS